MQQTTIKRHLQQLRAECIDNQPDPVLREIAYAMETAVRRVTEKTVGWPSLADEARESAKRFRRDWLQAAAPGQEG